MILLGFSFPSFGAIMPAFDSNAGNLGTSHNFGDFTVTAYGNINSFNDTTAYFGGPTGTGCVPDPTGSDCVNTIHLSNENPDLGKGLGVQEPIKNSKWMSGDDINKEYKGSSGISGKGHEENEQIVFDWGPGGVVASTVNFLLTGISLHEGGTDDMPILYIEGLGAWNVGGNWDNGIGGVAACSDADGGPANNGNFSCNLNLGTLNLGMLTTSRIAIRATGGEFKIGAVGPVSAVPVPAALPLFISALAGLGFFSRRRKAELIS